MNARFIHIAAITTFGLFVPQQANAAKYLVSYSGNITAGSDVSNLFGLYGQDIVGLKLRANILYSTSVGGVRTTDAISDDLAGGIGFGTSPVISSVVFTLGTKSIGFSPSYYSDVYTSPGFIDAYGYDLLGNSFQTYIIPDKPGPVNLQTPFYSTGNGDEGGASTQFSYIIAGNDDIDFDATKIRVSAVPECATWAMMLIGFGAMGYILRRRNTVFQPAASSKAQMLG